MALGFIIALFGGLGASLIAGHPENAAAVAVGAVSIDGDASLRDNARNVAESYRDAHGKLTGQSRTRGHTGDVAAEWESDRKDAEAEEAAWYGEY